MGMLTPSSVFLPQKICLYQFLDKNNHLIVLYCVFTNFLTILGDGVSYVTNGANIIKYGDAGTIIGFLTPKNISIPFFKWKQSFNHFLLCFYWIFDHFWGHWCHKRDWDYKIWGCWHHHWFSHHKKYIHTNF